jgi:hypothetical protein
MCCLRALTRRGFCNVGKRKGEIAAQHSHSFVTLAKTYWRNRGWKPLLQPVRVTKLDEAEEIRKNRI